MTNCNLSGSHEEDSLGCEVHNSLFCNAMSLTEKGGAKFNVGLLLLLVAVVLTITVFRLSVPCCVASVPTAMFVCAHTSCNTAVDVCWCYLC